MGLFEGSAQVGERRPLVIARPFVVRKCLTHGGAISTIASSFSKLC